MLLKLLYRISESLDPRFQLSCKHLFCESIILCNLLKLYLKFLSHVTDCNVSQDSIRSKYFVLLKKESKICSLSLVQKYVSEDITTIVWRAGKFFLSLGKNISLNCPNCFNKVKLNYDTKKEKKKSQNLSGSSEQTFIAVANFTCGSKQLYSHFTLHKLGVMPS